MYYINYIINLRGFVMMKRFVRCLEIKRLRNKCAMTCDLSPRPVGERVRERGYLADSLLSRLASHINGFDATHVAHWNNSRKIAFTLAEVLVTLGIIGVVSAMTVPTLMQNYQRQSYVTQLHKVYNEFQQGFIQEMTEKNAINLSEAGLGSVDNIDNFMKKHFKIVQDCGDTPTPCFADNYTSMSGAKSGGVADYVSSRLSYDKCYSLASGASVCISTIVSTREDILDGALWVDINGKKGPNIGGRDMSIMRYYSDGSIDVYGVTPECRNGSGACHSGYGTDATSIREGRFTPCQDSSVGDDCIGKLLNNNWEMIY